MTLNSIQSTSVILLMAQWVDMDAGKITHSAHDRKPTELSTEPCELSTERTYCKNLPVRWQ